MLIVAFASGVIVHNLEEAAFLVPWMRRHLRRLWFEPDPRIYWTLTTAISLIVGGAAVGLFLWPDDRQWLYALSGFALAMSVNAVLPHLALTLAFRSYSPGTASGLLLNLPFGLGFVVREMSSGWLSWPELGTGALAYAAALGVLAFGGLCLAHALQMRARLDSNQ